MIVVVILVGVFLLFLRHLGVWGVSKPKSEAEDEDLEKGAQESRANSIAAEVRLRVTVRRGQTCCARLVYVRFGGLMVRICIESCFHHRKISSEE